MIIYNKGRVSTILHNDGLVNYYGKILAYQEANQYLDSLCIKHQKCNSSATGYE
jgi:hypothetical protein